MGAKLTVMISGGGSNLKALIDACANHTIDAEIIAVMADRECAGLNHAVSAHIPFYQIDRKLPREQFIDSLQRTIPEQTDLIILAGYLSIIPAALIDAYPQRIINLHPSLLPKFGGAGMYGLRVHQAVLDAGETQSGCSVHYVDHGIDTGEVIAQAEVPVHPDDDAQRLQQRVQQQEHALLTRTVADLCHTFTHKTNQQDTPS
ncbi:phosphoribosylglycinamide formyltransferase [Suttonella sp. R2A3]|uniref:phosphoribosylglycinamide formyltransferase n=1 Tax=Suttonella sp. R2A3 TaxID=2908648 RepID=UPI001F18DE77|nr:phosphoribosylglycinamide formyltransferase [Suttonella sp. R2A3]UJF25194.1 phosphoribosylglycinamide formyltransferase [Suttonella sp. R2A3]